jgi:hypothetical protein
MPDGSHRQISADWRLTGGSNLSGTVVSRAAGDE